MLLEFKTKNFKCFKEELIFSMVPAPKQKGLDYSIRKQKSGSKTYKALCSAIIYGPNASGKTNIIGAMEVFKSIILRGNIRNTQEKSIPNAATFKLELIPNSMSNDNQPVEFSLKFIEQSLLIQYELSLDIGGFLDEKYPRSILFERLHVNEDLVFCRDQGLNFGNLNNIKNYLVNEFADNELGAKSLAKNNLNVEELFLINGFKAMFSAKLVNLILYWLNEKFLVIYRANALKLINEISEPKRDTIYIEEIMDTAAKIFGINSNAVGYLVTEDEKDPKICSIFKNKGAVIPAEMYESYGTIRFMNIFPLVIDAIINGGTLVIDEFDASIHPMAIMNIINIFHNDEINTHGAQLVFNTHNPIFLNSNLFRRDEIKFVERDDETHNSIHYSLSDFGTTGDKGVRKHEDYMNRYFVSQYGAIKEIDFTPILENILVQTEED
ncbi:MAG: AAA family ATPase [Deltaproteobacteria bacterium]